MTLTADAADFYLVLPLDELDDLPVPIVGEFGRLIFLNRTLGRREGVGSGVSRFHR